MDMLCDFFFRDLSEQIAMQILGLMRPMEVPQSNMNDPRRQ